MVLVWGAVLRMKPLCSLRSAAGREHRVPLQGPSVCGLLRCSSACSGAGMAREKGGKVLPPSAIKNLFAFILTKSNCLEMNEKNDLLLEREKMMS